MESMREKRDWGIYKRNLPAIEEMYMAGIRATVIAEVLDLDFHTLSTRICSWGLNDERDLYHADLAKEIAAKHAND